MPWRGSAGERGPRRQGVRPGAALRLVKRGASLRFVKRAAPLLPGFTAVVSRPPPVASFSLCALRLFVIKRTYSLLCCVKPHLPPRAPPPRPRYLPRGAQPASACSSVARRRRASGARTACEAGGAATMSAPPLYRDVPFDVQDLGLVRP